MWTSHCNEATIEGTNGLLNYVSKRRATARKFSINMRTRCTMHLLKIVSQHAVFALAFHFSCQGPLILQVACFSSF